MTDLFHIYKGLIPSTKKWQEPIVATDFVGEIFDKGHELPIGNFFTDKPIVFDRKGVYKLQGRGQHTIYYNETQGRRIDRNNHVASLMPLGDFDVIQIKSPEVHIEGGNINTSFAENHSSAGVLFDTDFDIQECSIEKMTIEGRYKDIIKTGIGTKGIDIKTKNITAKDAHVVNVKVSDMILKYCSKGFNVDKPDQSYFDKGAFINTFNLHFTKIWGCKQAINFDSPDTPDIEITPQTRFFSTNNIVAICQYVHDFPVLNEEEKDLFLINMMTAKSIGSFGIHDAGKKRNASGVYRHGLNQLRRFKNVNSNFFWNMHNGREF